ncbi:hypothetical protein ACFL2U_02590 [Patescibacteria group bacterium]
MADQDPQTDEKEDAATDTQPGPNAEEEKNKAALQADKQQDKTKKRAKEKSEKKAGKKEAGAAKRRAKAGASYNPWLYFLATLYALTFEVIMLIVSVCLASVSSYLDWIIDWFFLFPTLGLFLWSQGQGKGRVKKVLQKVGTAAGLETIPYIDYLPMWTLSVIWAWVEAWYNSKKQ